MNGFEKMFIQICGCDYDWGGKSLHADVVDVSNVHAATCKPANEFVCQTSLSWTYQV